MPEVWAVVVTFNRRALLEECLAALTAQTRPPDRILVVDNASGDGTADMIRTKHPQVTLLALLQNIGGAGGFHEGLRAAHEGGADWAWLMDDDTIPTPNALRELLRAPNSLAGLPAPLLLSSKAVWIDGQLHPMNDPALKQEPDHIVESCERGLLPLRRATFVSLLVHRAAVDAFGLPPKHYFIWSDDLEYTGRILKERSDGYLVPDSVVVHKTRQAHTAVIEGGPRFYFHVRNSLYMIRGSAWTGLEKLKLVWTLGSTTQAYLRRARFRRRSVIIVLRGVRDGLKRMPSS